MSGYDYAYEMILRALEADARGDYAEAERLRERARQAEAEAEREEYAAKRAKKAWETPDEHD